MRTAPAQKRPAVESIHPPDERQKRRVLTLPTLQRWFLDAITRPGELQPNGRSFALRDVLTDGPALTASERLGIYHSAYRMRLVECLSDDYPALRHALGEERFERLCLSVVAHHPPRGPNLNFYGKALVEHLSRGGRVPKRAFCNDLARLEWALVEALHAETPPRLDLAALQAVAPERWAGALFQGSRSLQVLAFAWPVNTFLVDYHQGRNPTTPAASPSYTAVYRQGYTIWRMDLSALTYGLLQQLLRGTPLGEAIGALEGHAEEGQVMEWFQAWVAGGFFEDVRL